MTAAFEELKVSRERLNASFGEGDRSKDYLVEYTAIVDDYFQTSVQESIIGQKLFKKKHPFAFVAVGGYGRAELCLNSDIDILILFRKKIPSEAKDLVEEIFFPLWDLGLDLGYGTRTIRDCLSLGKDDFEVMTSLMDARFICGDSPLYLSMMDDLKRKVISKKAIAFGRWLEEQDHLRMDTFGDASYLLEPNLKEGIGGLRDYHHIFWLAKALFRLNSPRDLEYSGKLSHKEYRTLQDDLAFIWSVRNHLHEISKRKNDRLGFEVQEVIAGRLGFKNRKDLPAVEQFMGKLHAAMSSIKSLHRTFIKSHLPKRKPDLQEPSPDELMAGFHLSEGELNFDSPTTILGDPQQLMDIFVQRAALNLPISTEAVRLVCEFLFLVDDDFRAEQRGIQGFLKVLRSEHTSETLDQMFETGFLETYIPEFGRIKDRVQFDTYHIYPVGRHVLETVRHLKELGQQKDILLLDIFFDLPDPEILFLGGFFHDIGKVGKDHSRKGVTITRNILKRFHYDQMKTEDVLFLIKNHLLLVETATRRDLHDEKVVVQCARIIGDINRLKMLYLLTWADANATGPRAWNEWIANLVQELFFKILHILEGGELATPNASKKVKKTKAAVRKRCAVELDGRDLENDFEMMSPRYLLSLPPRTIVKHLSALDRMEASLLKPGSPVFHLDTKEDESGGSWEATFLAMDRPGLFSDIAGVLALHNINILSADIFTWRNGIAVDIFRVTPPVDRIQSLETWKKVERDLKKTLNGKLSLPYRLSKKAEPSLFSTSHEPEINFPPKIVLDNDSSDFFTVIEIFANDRIGLLYDITHTLFNLRLDIRIAKISTKGDQIADVFYVKDLDGQKVEDPDQAEEIKKALLHQLK